MDQDLTELAVTGAKAIVSVMATDTWATAKGRVARIFSRKGNQSGRGVTKELEASRKRILTADGLSKAVAQQTEQDRWEARLRISLIDMPEMAPLLQDLIAAVLTIKPTNIANAGQVSLYAEAKDNSRVYQVGYGVQRNVEK
jgi:hypothetical protein